MIKNRTLQILLISVIVGIIVYTSYRMLQVNEAPEYLSVSVIVDNSSSDRWTAFREGLEQGALEEQINISVVSTDIFQSVEEEAALIRKELENDVDGLIVQPCADDVNGRLLSALPRAACVLAAAGIPSDPPMDVIRPDWYEMGAAAAQQAVTRTPGEKETGRAGDGSRKIGILSGNLGLYDMSECLKGAENILGNSEAAAAWSCSPDEIPDVQALSEKYAAAPVDLLLSLDDTMTKLAVDFVRQSPSGRIGLVGIGRSEQNITSLDEGWIQALVVPDEYYMGYYCVKSLSQKLNSYKVMKETAPVPFVTVTKDNIYDEDVEILLFPIVR